jgi:hypothetical protein
MKKTKVAAAAAVLAIGGVIGLQSIQASPTRVINYGLTSITDENDDFTCNVVLPLLPMEISASKFGLVCPVVN